MDKKYKFEFFQGSSVSGTGGSSGTSLSDAYRKGASVKNLISNTVVGSTEPETASNASASNVVEAPEAPAAPMGAGIGNLWNFLGIQDLNMKQKRCVYNCGIDVFGCLERCSNPDCRKQENLAYDQCKFGCMRRGINCTTTCISEIKPEKVPPMFSSDFVEPSLTVPVTSPSITEAATLSTTASVADNTMNNMNNFHIPPTEVHGIYDSLDTYAPFDMRVWPQEGKYGWTLSELARMKNAGYEAPNVIEVQMNHGLYPLKSNNPVLEFNYSEQ